MEMSLLAGQSQQMHNCTERAAAGHCDTDPESMKVDCKQECRCVRYAAAGECEKNPNYMLRYCGWACDAAQAAA